MRKGLLNKITDVDGVSVGHITLDKGSVQTGITVIKPADDSIFLNKMQVGAYVINGFGKTVGLMQIEEIGLLESPIALTNTLSVGRISDFMISHIIEECKGEKELPTSICTVVAECNDGRINDIRNRILGKEDFDIAFNNSSKDFELGAVGAGRGMVAYGLKAGIGSASRVVEYGDKEYTVGALVNANHGKIEQLMIDGDKVGKRLASKLKKDEELEQGSIIVVLATDAPLDSKSLKRLAMRATAGIARTGSEFGNGSGDIVIAFSTKNRVKHYYDKSEIKHGLEQEFLAYNDLDDLFSACVEAVEEAIYSSLKYAKRVGEDFCTLSELM